MYVFLGILNTFFAPYFDTKWIPGIVLYIISQNK